MRYARIKDYENYLVYDDGRIYNTKFDRFLKNEYVNLSKNGKSKKFCRYRLVAEYFVPNPNNENYVHHINCNHDDHRASNLQWIGQKEHQAIHAPDSHKPKPIIVIKDGIETTYRSIMDACNQLDLNGGAIYNCLNGKQQTYKGYTFKRPKLL